MSGFRVRQFSDTHFTGSGVAPYGGMGPDPDLVFDAVLAQLDERPGVDLTVVTGDLADHGEPGEYRHVAGQLGRLDGEVHVLAGNHDRRIHLGASPLADGEGGADRIRMPDSAEVGGWLFAYADSNGDGDDVDDDRGNDGKGVLADAEVDRLDRLLGGAADQPAFLWVHHPPCELGGFSLPEYVAQVEALVGRHPNVRGIGCGHAHTDVVRPVGGVPVHLCPSMTLSIDLDAGTTMPPGFREYRFGDDGTVDSVVVHVDDERWAERRPLPQVVLDWMAGLVDTEELRAHFGHH